MSICMPSLNLENASLVSEYFVLNSTSNAFILTKLYTLLLIYQLRVIQITFINDYKLNKVYMLFEALHFAKVGMLLVRFF